MTNLHFRMHTAPSGICVCQYNRVPRQMLPHAHSFTEQYLRFLSGYGEIRRCPNRFHVR